MKVQTGQPYIEHPGDRLIAGVDTCSGGNILVYKHQDDIMRHPYGDADMAIRVLGFYMAEKKLTYRIHLI